MQTAKLVRSFINSLAGNPSEVASRELERLFALPNLAHWYNTLRDALHAQRFARCKFEA
jgi:hypothetical protein